MRAITLFFAALTAVVSTAPGQTRDENRARCEDRDKEELGFIELERS
jgi:hypothetical protein